MIRYEVADGVARITIGRPERHNSLDREAIAAITEHYERADQDAGVRVVVLTAVGDRAFCAGADLKEMADHAQSGEPVDPRVRGRRLFEAILATRKPTIAAINGIALGVGCEIALACDLRLAVTHASLGLPEAKLGLGSMLGSLLLPRLLPPAVAMKMLYTGEPMPAEEGLRWGLLNSVVAPDRLDEETRALATAVAANAPLSLSRFKYVQTESYGLPVSAALRLEGGPDPYASADREEGVRAFVEKRAPVWLGR